MLLNFGRAGGVAAVHIDDERCTTCGLCVQVCKGAPLYVENGRICVDQSRYFGCIGCGHCITVCPRDCIAVTGRDLQPSDVVALPPQGTRANYEQFRSLLLARRSIRDFQDREVGHDIIEKIVDAASSAPMGIPPSEVSVLILAGKTKVKAFRNDLLNAMRSVRWMFSPLMLALLRPFIGKEAHALYRAFVAPTVDAYIEKDRQGVDWFFYDAPLALYFYGSPYADPADPLIAATYAMLAGESLGLGSCMLGFPAYIMQYSKKLKAKYRLPPRIQPGMVVVFGYPAVRHQRAIKRRFAQVEYV